MFWLIYILLFLLILLLIPIPIRLSFGYKKLSFNIYIYNFKVNVNKLLCFFKKNQNKPSKVKTKKEKDQKLELTNIFTLLNYIETIKYKPTLRFKLYCNFGLIDASKTAITYGYINSFSPILYKFLTIPFTIKKYDYEIKPDFDETFLETNIHSIIFVNLIKIIYMFILIKNKLKNLESHKHET